MSSLVFFYRIQASVTWIFLAPTANYKSFAKRFNSNWKAKIERLICKRQFAAHPKNKIIPEETKERIRRSLLERVSLEGICRIFDISMPWLLEFMEQAFLSLLEDLNATIIVENDEFKVFVLEADEL